jgi:hypothetical protein
MPLTYVNYIAVSNIQMQPLSAKSQSRKAARNGTVSVKFDSGEICEYLSRISNGTVSVKFDSGEFYEYLSRISKFCLNRTKISGTLRADRSSFYCFSAK